MGSAVSCDKCSRPETSSVINLSDALVLRVADGIEIPQPKAQTHASMEDADWFDKLKCFDDAHTSAYGLSMKSLDLLIKSVELRLRKGILHNYCPSDVVKGCYKFNSQCTLNCSKEVGEFIECIDVKRLGKLQALVERVEKEEAQRLAAQKKSKKYH